MIELSEFAERDDSEQAYNYGQITSLLKCDEVGVSCFHEEYLLEEAEVLGEYYEQYYPKRFLRSREAWAIVNLAKDLGIPAGFLAETLIGIRKGENLYREIYISKANGGKRKLLIPNKSLKLIQRRLNTKIFSFHEAGDNVFGFSGGNIMEALAPHCGAGSILCVDFVEAFSSVSRANVMWYFLSDMNASYIKGFHFSWYMSNILADFVVHDGVLPQGSPTSPRIFDLVCKDIDRRLNRIARNVGGRYARFADNIIFSFPEENFPKKLRNAILDVISKGGSHSPGFEFHKLRIRRIKRNSIKILGLNIVDAKICNTRYFKKRLRLLMHHVEWLLDNECSHEKPWLELEGLMSFAIKETLPKGLIEKFDALNLRIKAQKV